MEVEGNEKVEEEVGGNKEVEEEVGVQEQDPCLEIRREVAVGELAQA